MPAEGVAVGQQTDDRLVPVGPRSDLLHLAVRDEIHMVGRRAASTMSWPGSYSRCSNRSASAPSVPPSENPRSSGSSASSAGMTLTCAPVFTNVTRPSPTVYASRLFTRYVPPGTSTQGSMRVSHRELIPCIWGSDLVVVVRFRAAAVPRLCCSRSSAPAAGAVSVSTDMGSFSPVALVTVRFRTVTFRAYSYP